MTDAIWQIERQRRKLGLSQTKLAGLAGINPTHYSDLVARKKSPRKTTISRLKMALIHHDRGDSSLYELVIFRLCLMAVCQQQDQSPAEVLMHDPKRKANADPDWKRAADIRRKALYLAHSFCQVPQSRLAKLIGVTPAAVSLAISNTECADDLDTDPLIQLIEAAIGSS